MLRLFAGRLLSFALTLVAASLAVFLVMDLLPGDPASIMLGTSATPETLAALRAELGLDRPLLLRYAEWGAGLLAGDFGRSVTYGVPVAGLVTERLLVTLPLALFATLLSLGIALPLGTLAAVRRGRAADGAATLLAQASLAMPNFWIGLLLILVFSRTLGLLPAGGFPGWDAGLEAALEALVLPGVALALPQAGVLVRVTRSAVSDTLGEDFVRTARAKGLTRRAALLRHALPNALPAVLTILGLQFTFLVAGTVLVENVFALPGLGQLAYQSLQQRDLVVLRSVVLMLAALVIAVNFLVDLAHLRLDPRLAARR